MIKKGWQQLRQQKKNGISMAVVLCVSAFFVAFAAAILYTAGMLTAQSNLRLKQERCSQLAKSAADVLDQELQKYTNKDTTEAGSDSFYTFVNKFLDDSQYLDYSEDYPDATKYNFLVSDTDLSDLSKADALPEGYGNIRIALTKEKNASEDSDSLKTGEIHTAANNAANYKTEIDRIRNITVRDYNFSVAVTASYEDATYTYTTEYSREEKYDVKFTHNGKVIVWDDTNSCWRVGNTSGEVYTPDTSQNIQYEFLNTTTSCVFKENVYTETAGGGTAGDD